MGVLIGCQALEKSFSTRPLFENLTFGVDEGERLGVIGPNGSGKSTLLKILAGLETSDAGTLSVRRGVRMCYAPQDPVFEAETNAETVLWEALEELHLEDRERANRVSAMIGRMGFTPQWRSNPVETLSGGWRKRLAIARELIREPDLLLLDEPTNHLDLEGIEWFERLLANAQFACVLISHDRYFLENAATRVFELNRCYPEGFYSAPGKYSNFLLKREEFLCGQQQAQRSLESKVRREIEWLNRGAHGRTTKQKARIGEAGRLIEELSETKSRNSFSSNKVSIQFSSSDRQANKLVVMKKVDKSLGGRMLIEGLNLVVSPGMKLGLLGRNGSGKTTFLRLLTGELEPDAGTIERADRLRVVCFDQNREQLDKEETLRRALAPTGDTVSFRDQPVHVTAWAKRFLFKVEQLDMQVKALSGGEQARILIARLMLRPADLLLLDEPTNDLDIPSLEVLEDSLLDFPGALVLVTHDRYMLRRISTDLLGLDGLGGAHLYGDYTQWENAQKPEPKASASGADRPAAKAPSPAKDSGNNSGNGQKSDAPKNSKRLSFKEQKEWDLMEAAILKDETAVEKLQKELDDPAISNDAKRLQDHCKALADAQARVERLYARWQELEEKQR